MEIWERNKAINGVCAALSYFSWEVLKLCKMLKVFRYVSSKDQVNYIRPKTLIERPRRERERNKERNEYMYMYNIVP